MPETQIEVTPQTPETPVLRDSPVQSKLDIESLMTKHFGDDLSGTPAPQTPEDEVETPTNEEDTPDGHPDSDEELADTETDTEEGVETGDELEEEVDDEETLEDEDDEIQALLDATEDEDPKPKDTPKESFLPEFDRVKFLKEHPELELPYKHMQAAFSKKMAEASTLKKRSEEVEARAQSMEQHYLSFQETLKNDDTFEEFLVQVAIGRPEVMQKAYDRAADLAEDEGKKKEYLRDKELADTKRQLEEKNQREEAVARQNRTVQIVNTMKKVAEKLGLNGEGDLEVAEQFVANQILQNNAKNGKPDITNEELVMAVRRAAKALEAKKNGVRKTVKAEVQRKGLQAAKDRAKAPKRPAPPRSAAPAAHAPAPKRIDNRPKQSGLDSFIDSQLGVEA